MNWHLPYISNLSHLLTRAGIRNWLALGSLLGAVRDSAPIEWDADVDFGILEPDAEKVLLLSESIERLSQYRVIKGQSLIRLFWTKGGIDLTNEDTALASTKGHAYIDVYPYRRNGPMLESVVTYGHIPVACVVELTKVKFGELRFPAPQGAKEILSHTYGSQWAIPMNSEEYRPKTLELARPWTDEDLVLLNMSLEKPKATC